MGMSFLRRGQKSLMAAAVLVCLLCLNLNVNAYTLVDTDSKTNLTIAYEMADVEFSIYKVADMSEDVRFTPTETFASYPVSFEGLDTNGWRVLADTLSGYVVKDHIVPHQTGVTEENGILIWENLDVGLYLVIGDTVSDDGYVYHTSPLLVTLPFLTEEDVWEYQPRINVKYEKEELDVMDLLVLKIWKDEGFEQDRPEEIKADLLKNGEVTETVTLSKENDWAYEWTDLSTEFEWKVVEKDVPEEYTVTSSREGNVYEVVNTREDETDSEEEETLPQTGQLWWPVPILAVSGLFLFLLGWIRKRYEG